MYLINLIAGDIMTQNSTQAKRPHAAINLPLTLVSLDEWSLITATGADSEKYLQGQLTTDIAALPTTTHTLSAHCEAKGKCGVRFAYSTSKKVLLIFCVKMSRKNNLLN